MVMKHAEEFDRGKDDDAGMEPADDHAKEDAKTQSENSRKRQRADAEQQQASEAGVRWTQQRLAQLQAAGIVTQLSPAQHEITAGPAQQQNGQEEQAVPVSKNPLVFFEIAIDGAS